MTEEAPRRAAAAAGESCCVARGLFARVPRQERRSVERPSRVAEPEPFARRALDREQALVHSDMVSSAQGQNIFECILATGSSGLIVVKIDETEI